ncbi:MAG: RluA family pseudouridine synthase [Anaerolineales bacterium]
MTQHLRFQVEDGANERLDRFLSDHNPQHSRARLQALIKGGHVHVDGRILLKAGYTLGGGEVIELEIPAVTSTDLIPEDIPLDIVFENKDVIVINKSAGLVVHPAAGHTQGTLMNAVLAHSPEIEGIGGELRPGLVHRLDKDTSGLIVLAKNEQAQNHLQAQFQSRDVAKTYIALVDGHPPSRVGRIEAPIGRSPADRKRMAVVAAKKGRAARTDYREIERFESHSLLEVQPHTGRTHQIRVHLATIGCPVAGDRVYGRRKPTLPLQRQFLHAARLKLTLPGKNSARTFEAPLPPDLQSVLETLRSPLGQTA